MCHVSNQIAKHCDEEETYCEACGSTMTLEIESNHGLLVCDDRENCNHKVWADGDEY